MNEVQLIRSELAQQRGHAREVATSWLSHPAIYSADILNTYDKYFVSIIDAESARIRSHLERLRSRSELSDVERRLLDRCAGEFETLAAERTSGVSAGGGAPDAVARKASLSSRLSMLAEELERIAAACYAVNDWRLAAHVDADSILEERRLRKQVLEHANGPAIG